jgi:hypothetical protein
LLPVENPGYLFVRESAATMEETYKLFSPKKKGSSSSKPSQDNLFEEALGFRVSSEY